MVVENTFTRFQSVACLVYINFEFRLSLAMVKVLCWITNNSSMYVLHLFHHRLDSPTLA